VRHPGAIPISRQGIRYPAFNGEWRMHHPECL
jgi:hypothetical protein